MTKYDNVIIFGATGDVGSFTALEASKRGAKVWLAMRDTSKSIQGISKEVEQQASFKRVKADLTDPVSVKNAVKESGARAAFFYLVHGHGDLRDSIEAMKEGGIEYLVFLSTMDIRTDDLRSLTMKKEPIAFIHAQIELALQDSGVRFVAIRPGFFASNNLKHNLDTSKEPWEAVLMRNPATWDNVSTFDVGRLSGAVLVNPISDAQREAIYIFGPELLTQDEMWETIQRSSSQQITITYLPQDEYEQYQIQRGLPPPLASYFAETIGTLKPGAQIPEHILKAGEGTLAKYAGYKAQTFAEWTAINVP